MKRVIPKNTKIVTTLWKSYTVVDFAIAAVILAIVLVAASSNLEGKWFVAGAFLIIGFFLLVDWGGDEKGYMFFASIIKYLASPKLLKKGAAKNSIDDVLPYVDIEEGAYIKYRAGYYAKVIEIGQIEFGLLSESSQDSRISAFEKVLCLLDDSQRAELVKIDRPLNFDDWAYDVYEQLEETDNEVKKAILESRLFDVDVINNIEKIYTNSFYFVFYANDKARLDDLCVEAVDILQSNKMSAALLDEKQTAVHRLTDGIPELSLLVLRRQPGELGENHVGNRQNKHARHHQIQVGGVFHSRHTRSVVEVGAELGVDGQVNGLHPGGHHHRTHEGEGLTHSLRPEGEVRVVMKVQLPQGGHLNDGLEKPAHQIGRRQSVNAKPIIQKEKVADDDQIGHGADEGRDGAGDDRLCECLDAGAPQRVDQLDLLRVCGAKGSVQI